VIYIRRRVVARNTVLVMRLSISVCDTAAKFQLRIYSTVNVDDHHRRFYVDTVIVCVSTAVAASRFYALLTYWCTVYVLLCHSVFFYCRVLCCISYVCRHVRACVRACVHSMRHCYTAMGRVCVLSLLITYQTMYHYAAQNELVLVLLYDLS